VGSPGLRQIAHRQQPRAGSLTGRGHGPLAHPGGGAAGADVEHQIDADGIPPLRLRAERQEAEIRQLFQLRQHAEQRQVVRQMRQPALGIGIRIVAIVRCRLARHVLGKDGRQPVVHPGLADKRGDVALVGGKAEAGRAFKVVDARAGERTEAGRVLGRDRRIDGQHHAIATVSGAIGRAARDVGSHPVAGALLAHCVAILVGARLAQKRNRHPGIEKGLERLRAVDGVGRRGIDAGAGDRMVDDVALERDGMQRCAVGPALLKEAPAHPRGIDVAQLEIQKLDGAVGHQANERTAARRGRRRRRRLPVLGQCGLGRLDEHPLTHS